VRYDVGAVCPSVPVDIDWATRSRLSGGRIDRIARCRLIGMRIGQRQTLGLDWKYIARLIAAPLGRALHRRSTASLKTKRHH